MELSCHPSYLQTAVADHQAGQQFLEAFLDQPLSQEVCFLKLKTIALASGGRGHIDVVGILITVEVVHLLPVVEVYVDEYARVHTLNWLVGGYFDSQGVLVAH